jgi:hypothetical protein
VFWKGGVLGVSVAEAESVLPRRRGDLPSNEAVSTLRSIMEDTMTVELPSPRCLVGLNYNELHSLPPAFRTLAPPAGSPSHN